MSSPTTGRRARRGRAARIYRTPIYQGCKSLNPCRAAVDKLNLVEEAHARADELMQAWEQELRRELPADPEIFDAHVHLGTDIDGFRGDYEELERVQQRFRISRAFVFCLDE